LAIKILEIDSVCSKSCSNEHLEKAALWDTLCLLNKPEFRWLLPFFWSKETNRASDFAKSMAMVYVCSGGSRGITNALSSTLWLSIADVLRDFQELGGHPIRERSLLVLLRLINESAYEDVLKDEKETEVLMLYERKQDVSNGERNRAVERAKHRVKRAKNLLRHKGINVKRLSLEDKSFRKLLLKAESKLNENKHSDS